MCPNGSRFIDDKTLKEYLNSFLFRCIFQSKINIGILGRVFVVPLLFFCSLSLAVYRINHPLKMKLEFVKFRVYQLMNLLNNQKETKKKYAKQKENDEIFKNLI